MVKTAILVVALVFMGCGPSKVGESCDLLGKTLCEKCFPDSSTTCMGAFYGNCCKGSTCEMPVRDSGKVVECNNLLKQTSCSSLSQGNLPTICRGVAAP